MSNKRNKNFGSPNNKDLENITFDLYDETFECYPELQGTVLLQFSERVSSEAQSDVSRALLDFFEEALLPESYERFVTLTKDKKKIIKIEVLGDIVSYLVEEYTDNRPTEASSES